MQERKEKAAKAQKKQLGKLKKDLQTEAAGEAESCFIVPGRDAGTGLSLRLDNEDDSSTDEEDVEDVQGSKLSHTHNFVIDIVIYR